MRKTKTARGVSVRIGGTEIDPESGTSGQALVTDGAGTVAPATVAGSGVSNPLGADLSAANTYKVTSLADATADGEAVNLKLLRQVGLKLACVVATTSNITLSGEQTLDGVTTSASRVLVNGQTLPQQNGIYVSAAGAWTRATDADTVAKLPAGTFVSIAPGATLTGGKTYKMGAAPTVLGTTAIAFTEFGASTPISPLTADLDAAGYRVKNLPFPGADTDPTRRIDRFGLRPVQLVAVVALPANTYSAAGGGGRGTLTANANGVLPSIDGKTAAVGDRLFLTAEATLANRGIYVVTSVGSGGAPWVLTRAEDCPHGAAVPNGLLVLALNGDTATSAIITCSGVAATIGTDPFGWSLDVVRTTFVTDVNGNSKKLSAVNLLSSQVGDATTRTTYDGATKVLSTTKSANFTAEPTVPRYRLTADTLTITINEATWTVGDVVTFTSVTETASPGHTFACSSTGKFKFAGSGGGGSGVSTAPWPSGATVVVIECDASGVFIRN